MLAHIFKLSTYCAGAQHQLVLETGDSNSSWTARHTCSHPPVQPTVPAAAFMNAPSIRSLQTAAAKLLLLLGVAEIPGLNAGWPVTGHVPGEAHVKRSSSSLPLPRPF
jgi:hypothetical protein